MILPFHIAQKINEITPYQTKTRTKYQKPAKHRKLMELYFLLMEVVVIISCAPYLNMFIVMITWHQQEYQHSLNADVSAMVVSLGDIKMH